MTSPLTSTQIRESASQEGREQTGQRIALLSIFVGVILSIAKVIVGFKAGSSAVISDGVEAGGDVLSSTIVYAGLWLASRPPDAEHPYGHGRYETLAGLGVAALLLVTGAGILWHSLTSGRPVLPVAAYALYPLVAAVVLKATLAVLKLRVGKQIDSGALQADAWHDLTDLLSTFVALAAVILTIANPARFHFADRTGALLIGAIIVLLSVKVVRRTITSLLDTMPEPERMQEIRLAALSVPGALGVEKCFARRTGLTYHVDLHLEVDPELTVRESHEIATAVKQAIKDRVQWVADVLIHVEPWGLGADMPAVKARHSV
jgi:cation diffusion facilitator family transporter